MFGRVNISGGFQTAIVNDLSFGSKTITGIIFRPKQIFLNVYCYGGDGEGEGATNHTFIEKGLLAYGSIINVTSCSAGRWFYIDDRIERRTVTNVILSSVTFNDDGVSFTVTATEGWSDGRLTNIILIG